MNVVVSDPERMEKYRWDRANDPGAGTPLVVLRVRTTEDVQVAVRFAVISSSAPPTSSASPETREESP
jgi:FAD/FMN-containing dehydrogenase